MRGTWNVPVSADRGVRRCAGGGRSTHCQGMTPVIHNPRLAWDGAMAFVGASAHPDLYGWLAERLTDVLGPSGGEALAETRVRLTYSRRPDAPQVESGRWRARLE